MVIEKISSRVSPIAAIAVAFIVMAGAIVLDFLTSAHFNPSILYIPALVLVAIARKRRLVWSAAILAMFLTMAGIMWGPKPDLGASPEFRFYITLNRAQVILSLAATAVVAHLWIRAMNMRDEKEKELQQQNDELAAREEEIARQN